MPGRHRFASGRAEEVIYERDGRAVGLARAVSETAAEKGWEKKNQTNNNRKKTLKHSRKIAETFAGLLAEVLPAPGAPKAGGSAGNSIAAPGDLDGVDENTGEMQTCVGVEG